MMRGTVRLAFQGSPKHTAMLIARGLQRASGLGFIGDLLSDAEAVCRSIGYPCSCAYYQQSGPFTSGTQVANMPICYVPGINQGFGADLITLPRGDQQLLSDIQYYFAPAYTPPPSAGTVPNYVAPAGNPITINSPSQVIASPVPTASAPAPAPAAPTYAPAPSYTYTPQASTHAQVPATVTLPAAAQAVITAAGGTQYVGGGYELSRTTSTTSAAGANAAAAAAASSTLDSLWNQAIEHKNMLLVAAAVAAAFYFGSSRKSR